MQYNKLFEVSCMNVSTEITVVVSVQFQSLMRGGTHRRFKLKAHAFQLLSFEHMRDNMPHMRKSTLQTNIISANQKLRFAMLLGKGTTEMFTKLTYIETYIL